MIGEPVVAELKRIVKTLKYPTAVWEWALWHGDTGPRIHFLKITLSPTSGTARQTRLFHKSALSLFRSKTSVREVRHFLDYCLSARREFEKTNTLPASEPGFRLSRYKIPLFGNFPASAVELVGSHRAKDYWLFKSSCPFFLAEYALHDSAKAQIPHGMSFYDTDPPFANFRELYVHYFSVNVGERYDPWVGIVLPVQLAHIKSFKTIGKDLHVHINGATPLPKSLSLSVVCRGTDGAAFRTKVPNIAHKVISRVGFKPTSIDLALQIGELRIDFIEWHHRRREPPTRSKLIDIQRQLTPGEYAPLFDMGLLEKLPHEIRMCLELAEQCAIHGLWIPASLMLRKALDKAINLKMKQLGSETELYDEKSQEKPLAVRLQLLGDRLPALRRDMREFLMIKWYGDKGAHTKMPIYENDVRSIVGPRLRAFLAELELRKSHRV